MAEKEIKITDIISNAVSSRDYVGWTRTQAEIIYLFLIELGATKDARFFWDEETGRIHIMKKFKYSSPILGCDVNKEGDQYYTLHSYIKTLIRFDKAAHKRMKNVRDKINDMNKAVRSLEKQLDK
jgi:hypothetical protein